MSVCTYTCVCVRDCSMCVRDCSMCVPTLWRVCVYIHMVGMTACVCVWHVCVCGMCHSFLGRNNKEVKLLK